MGIKVQALPHYPLCIVTKLAITSLIAFKLLRQRRTIQRTFNQAENREELIKPYTSLIQILTTSYALSSAISALFLGLYISNLESWRIVLPNTLQAEVWCSISSLCEPPILIIIFVLAYITSTRPRSSGTKPLSSQNIRRHRIVALRCCGIDSK